MTSRLASRIAIVTGASSVLWRCISLTLAADGPAVICADLVPTARHEIDEGASIKTHELIRQRGGNAIFVKADVSVASDMQRLARTAVEWGGRLDMSVALSLQYKDLN
jgi:NAD(P)-dependent dehydrogenase (short-subunit alcohol dehydrogenase family)